MFLEGSVFYQFDDRITALENRNFDSLASRLETAESDIDDIEEDVADLVSRCGTLESTVSSHGSILGVLEAWKAVMPKRQDIYTGTTDANGDLTITFPGGRYTNVPHVALTYIFNNDNYGTFYNIKALSTSSVTIRVMRNKNSAVLLGGNIDPDEPLASISVTIIATEFS